MAQTAPNHSPAISARICILGGMALVAAFHVLAMLAGAAPDFSGGNWYVNWDTDSYSRVLRVLQLHETGAWYDTTAPYFNAPFGTDMHWTRPLDLLLYSGAWVGSFFTDFKTALEVWGMVAVGPLLHVLFVPLLYWGLRSEIAPHSFLLLILMFLSLTEVSRVHLSGFIDFHGLQVMVLLALQVLLVKRLQGGASLDRHTMVMGVIAGIGVWISVESLMLALPAVIALAVLWVWDGDDWLDELARFCFGFGVALALALVVERPPNDWLTIEYDRVSIVHPVMALTLSVVTWVLLQFDERDMLETWQRRAAAGLLVAAPTIFGLLIVFPPLIGHPQQELGPIADMVLDTQAGEMPFFAGGLSPLTVFTRLGPLLIAVPYSLWLFFTGDPDARRRALVYLIFMATMTTYLLFFGRAITFAQIAFLLPWFDAVLAVFSKLRDRFGPVALLAQVALLMVVFAHSGAYAMTKINAASQPAHRYPSCRTDEVLAFIAQPGVNNRGRSVLAPIFMGPVIAYKSGYSVLSSPYHRNVPGIEVGFILTWSDPDDPQMQELARSRAIEYVFLCRSYVGYKKHLVGQNTDTLIARLAADRPPAWLSKVELPPRLENGAILYRWNGD